MTRPRQPTVTAPAERVGFLIYRAGLLVSRAYEARMRPLGYSPVEVGVMTWLASGGQNHVRGIARALGVSPQTVVNVSTSLEGRQMARRERSTTDHRLTKITLTGDGLAEVVKIDAVVKAFDEEIAAKIGQDEAVAILRGLAAFLEAGLS